MTIKPHGSEMGKEGGQGLDTPSPPLAKLLCCELLVLHWLSPQGKSYEGGGKSIFNCVKLGGGGGGSTSVHLILWCSLTHKSAHFSFFLCFFVFFFLNAGCTKQEDLSLCFKPCGFFIS